MTALKNKKIAGKQRKSYPGDKVYVMTASHKSVNGKTYPAGTEYTPLFSGSDNVRGIDQTVSISGSDVEFRF